MAGIEKIPLRIPDQWSPEWMATFIREVLSKLDTTMTAAYLAVSELARKRKLSMRDAAYFIAISRVADACRARGWV